MINLDTTYLTELKRKLEYEQWSSIGAKKLQDAEFADLIQCAIYFLEHDGKIKENKKVQQTESPLADITGVF